MGGSVRQGSETHSTRNMVLLEFLTCICEDVCVQEQPKNKNSRRALVFCVPLGVLLQLSKCDAGIERDFCIVVYLTDSAYSYFLFHEPGKLLCPLRDGQVPLFASLCGEERYLNNHQIICMNANKYFSPFRWKFVITSVRAFQNVNEE